MISGKELMIGDWLMPKDVIMAVQVTGIVSDTTIMIDGNRALVDNYKPIELTQEFLFKNTYSEEFNAYRVYAGNGFIQYCLSDSFVVKCYTEYEKDVFKYEGLTIRYIHELQHLLKIAGVAREIEL